MNKAVVSGAILALLAGTTVAASAGTEAGQGAQKRGLFATTEDGTDCNASTNTSPGSPNGFVILNAPGKVAEVTKIVGEVSLKKAPGTYTVELAVNGECMPQVGMLTTNDQGNGNFHIDFAGTLGSTYYVVLRKLTGTASFASNTVTLI